MKISAKTDCWDLDGCAGRAVSGESEWQRLWRESRRRGQSVHFDSKFSPKSHTYFFNSQNKEKLIFFCWISVWKLLWRESRISSSHVDQKSSLSRKISAGEEKLVKVSANSWYYLFYKSHLSLFICRLCQLVDAGFMSNTGLVEPYHQFFFTLYSSFSFELTLKSH